MSTLIFGECRYSAWLRVSNCSLYASTTCACWPTPRLSLRLHQVFLVPHISSGLSSTASSRSVWFVCVTPCQSLSRSDSWQRFSQNSWQSQSTSLRWRVTASPWACEHLNHVGIVIRNLSKHPGLSCNTLESTDNEIDRCWRFLLLFHCNLDQNDVFCAHPVPRSTGKIFKPKGSSHWIKDTSDTVSTLFRAQRKQVQLRSIPVTGLATILNRWNSLWRTCEGRKLGNRKRLTHSEEDKLLKETDIRSTRVIHWSW